MFFVRILQGWFQQPKPPPRTSRKETRPTPTPATTTRPARKSTTTALPPAVIQQQHQQQHDAENSAGTICQTSTTTNHNVILGAPATASATAMAVEMLMDMGFEFVQAQQAAERYPDNLDHAVQFLLAAPSISQDGDGAGGGLSTNDTVQVPLSDTTARMMIRGPISQYSIPDGRSACTCIALVGARQFLLQQREQQQQNSDIITSQFLCEMIVQGVACYGELIQQQQQQQHQLAEPVQHLSAEQVLTMAPGWFSALQLMSNDSNPSQSIRQGIIMSQDDDPTHPLGLYQQLLACQATTTTGKWTAVVMIKSPETILILLPPTNNSDSDKLQIQSPSYYWLIDSHPRPHLFAGAEQAYARGHDTLNDLLDSLDALFPIMDISNGDGNDQGNDFLAAMYNAFDLYPMQLVLDKRTLYD